MHFEFLILKMSVTVKHLYTKTKHEISQVCITYFSLESFQGSLLKHLSPSLLTPLPSGSVKAGDHHNVGLADADPVLQPSRHLFKGLQVLQGVHVERLPQVN